MQSDSLEGAFSPERDEPTDVPARSPAGTTVAIPIYNEEANLESLLRFLADELGIAQIVAVDDRSTDASFEIATRCAKRDPRLLVLQTPERSGQLAAWRLAARTAMTPSVVFVDADARPGRGSVAMLSDALAREERLVAASGRPRPDEASAAWPPGRFRSELLHRVRALQRPKEVMIGRFFAVRRDWFIANVTRSDIIANDAFVGALAQREHRTTRYIPEAVCYYCEATTTFDLAAQRQRADAGYEQLRQLGILLPQDEPTAREYAACFATCAVRDPIGATMWLVAQSKARGMRAYRRSGRDAGAWETQATTKRRVG